MIHRRGSKLAIASSNSSINKLAPSPGTCYRMASREPEQREVEDLKKKRSRVVSGFLPSPLFLRCSLRPQQRGDPPRASQVTSSPGAPQIAVLDTRRFFSFFFSSFSPSLGVEEIGRILRSNHRQRRHIRRVKSTINQKASRCISVTSKN